MACKIVLAAYHHYPENIQRRFRLQNWLSRKSSLSWKHSKTFSPEKLSSTQIIIILKIFKDFFACEIASAANHHYPEKKRFKNFFACKIVLARNQHFPENIQRLIRRQNCLRRKSSLSWKYSKTFSPAKLPQLQIIIILKLFKDFFACKIVFDANHHYPEKNQGLFRLQKCLSRKSSLSWKQRFKNLFACKIVLARNQHFPEIIQRLIRRQICLRRKSSLSCKYSKTFSPAKLPQLQIIIILKLFKDFFACKIVFDANHLYPENIQRLFRLQNCLSRKSSLSWKGSKTFSPAKLS